MIRFRESALLWLPVAIVVLVLDQWTKSLATQMLPLYQPVEVIPHFNLTLSHNTGAAFSLLADQGGWQRWFFTVVAAVVSAGLVMYLRYKVRASEKWAALAFVLILGGALGNLWDRIRLGYVVDFIDLYYGQYHWPAFNVADSAISVGAVMLIIEMFRPGNHTEKAERPGTRK